MQGQHDDDRDGTVGQPLRCRDAQGRHESRRAADPFRLEHRQPGLRLCPGGDHVGNDDRQGEKAFAGKIRADHQPGEDRAEKDREEGNRESDQQRIEQRLEQQFAAQFAGQQSLPVIQGERAGLDSCPGRISLCHGKGGLNHLKERHDDQVKKQNDRDQHNHIVRIGDHIQDLILQPSGFGIADFACVHLCSIPSSQFRKIPGNNRTFPGGQTFARSLILIIQNERALVKKGSEFFLLPCRNRPYFCQLLTRFQQIAGQFSSSLFANVSYKHL